MNPTDVLTASTSGSTAALALADVGFADLPDAGLRLYAYARSKDVQASLKVRCGSVGTVVRYRTHGHRRRDDDVGEFVQKVLAGPADTLAAVQPTYSDERLCDLTGSVSVPSTTPGGQSGGSGA